MRRGRAEEPKEPPLTPAQQAFYAQQDEARMRARQERARGVRHRGEQVAAYEQQIRELADRAVELLSEQQWRDATPLVPPGQDGERRRVTRRSDVLPGWHVGTLTWAAEGAKGEGTDSHRLDFFLLEDGRITSAPPPRETRHGHDALHDLVGWVDYWKREVSPGLCIIGGLEKLINALEQGDPLPRARGLPLL